ncbi:MAG: thioredoxin [Eggerthellaceae bacterium]
MAEVIDSQQFKEKVLNADKPVLVDFFATWCGPCKMLSPMVDQVAQEKAGQIDVYKVDVDESPDLAQEYGVMSVPTVIAFENGAVKDQFVGVKPKEAILGLFA